MSHPIFHEEEEDGGHGGHEEHEKEHNQEKETNTTTSGKRSWVWEHYTNDDTTKKARCNHCKTLITINKGSTSGMSSHLRSRHKIERGQEQEDSGSKQLTLQESLRNSTENMVNIIFYLIFS